MSIQLKCEGAENKLGNLCKDNNLKLEFIRNSFPAIFRFTHDQSTAYQIELNETDMPRPLDPNAAIEMIFGDDVKVRVTGDIEIGDDVLNSLKSGAKKLHYLFLQVWFKTHIKARQAQTQASQG